MPSLTIKDRLICWLAYLFARTLHASYRYRWYGLEHYEKACELSTSQRPVIAIWHQNCLASIQSHAHRRLAIVVSRSFDGEVISSVARRFGMASARGSSHRGGLEALREVVKLIKNGYAAGITVDGPTGPRHEVKPGVISIAALAGSAVVPFAAVGLRTWTFTRSWDQFRLPKPFSRIICMYGPPQAVPKRLGPGEQEALALRLQESLLELEAELANAATFHLPAEHEGIRPEPPA